ncbi:MAG: TetR/AcrR family transcriptional regulator [Bacillota bacterium]|nr:TetR/AcrR family transcriptional regulator [Bacillota bacterium]
MKGSKGEAAKERLIEVASKLFLERGYSNTGINDVLAEAEMSKGSFYFHFSSKKELALEVAKYHGKNILENWLTPISNNTWEVFINQMVNDIIASAKEGNYYGCPIAVLGLEIAFIEDELSNAYTLGMNKLISIFSNSLQHSGLPKDKADKGGRRAFAVFEGHILYYRISKELEAFDYLREDLLAVKNRAQ